LTISSNSAEPLVIFAGAGISANPPTGFPIASTIIRTLIEHIAPDEPTKRCLLKMADPSRPERQNPGDYIRFEVLLETIQRIIDPQLELLDIVSLFQTPNQVHSLFAQRAVKGDLLVTTNFDMLFEKAILNAGGEPYTVIDDEDFSRWRQLMSMTPIFKLHGSYAKNKGSQTEISKESIKATLASVAMGLQGLELPPEKRRFIQEAFSGRSIVFAGYSGADDLDIMPTLLHMTDVNVLWIEHDGASKSESDITHDIKNRVLTLSVLSARDRLFRHLFMHHGSALRVIKARTPEFLSKYFGGTAAHNTSSSTQNGSSTWESFLDKWRNKKVQDKSLGHIVAADLLLHLGRFEIAREQLANAWQMMSPTSRHRSTVACMTSKSEIRLANKQEALHWASIALRHLTNKSAAEERFRCYHQYGYSNYVQGNPTEAAKWYKKNLTMARKTKNYFWLAVDLHQYAVIQQDHGHYNEAIKLYKDSIRFSSRAGDIGHIAWSQHQLGTCYFDQGEFELSQRCHEESARIAEAIGDLNHLSLGEHELGLLAFLGGRLLEAAKHFRKALRLDSLTKQAEFRALEWQHLGAIFLEVGKYRTADRYFAKALQHLENSGDEETKGELYGYWAQNDLEMKNANLALKKAHEALRLSEAVEVPTYINRAKFILYLAQLHEDDSQAEQKLLDVIYSTQKSEFRALLLDQIYILCRLGTSACITDPDIRTISEWARDIYARVGNKHRQLVVEICLRRSA
jgi:tetratricopeptide (TPR) repeat protein